MDSGEQDESDDPVQLPVIVPVLDQQNTPPLMADEQLPAENFNVQPIHPPELPTTSQNNDTARRIQKIQTSASLGYYGDAMQYDPRLPRSSMFSRMESFRGCGLDCGTNGTFAKRGFYCSGVYHNLRCIGCPGILGICHDFVEPEDLVHECREGKTMPVEHVNMSYKRRFDAIQDCNEFVFSPPKSREVYLRYSSAEIRLQSFCHPSVDGNLRSHVGRLATAGFFYKIGMSITTVWLTKRDDISDWSSSLS